MVREKGHSIQQGLMVKTEKWNKCLYRIGVCRALWTDLSQALVSISPYSVRMRENTDQNNSEYGHFLRSICLCDYA